MAVSHFRILNNKLLNKDQDVVPQQATLIILYRKSAIYMAKNFKAKKTHHTHFQKSEFSKKW